MQSILGNNDIQAYNGLTLGKVYNVYSEANMVDVMLFGGSLFKKVQVMVGYASSQIGSVGLALSKYKAAGAIHEDEMLHRKLPLQEAGQDESDVVAVIAFLGGSIIRPIVLGFLFPEENELLCSRTQKGNEDGSMFLWKHGSNSYVRVSKGSKLGETAEIEISHPSGCFIKIGGDSVRTIITNYDTKIRPFNPNNPVTKQPDPAPYLSVIHPSGTTLVIDPEGNVDINVVGDVTKTVEGNVTETIKGDVTQTIKGDVNRTVEGAETTTVKGDWERYSDSSILDSAPSVQHNSG